MVISVLLFKWFPWEHKILGLWWWSLKWRTVFNVSRQRDSEGVNHKWVLFVCFLFVCFFCSEYLTKFSSLMSGFGHFLQIVNRWHNVKVLPLSAFLAWKHRVKLCRKMFWCLTLIQNHPPSMSRWNLCVFSLTKWYFPSWKTKECLNFFVVVMCCNYDGDVYFIAHQERHLS